MQRKSLPSFFLSFPLHSFFSLLGIASRVASPLSLSYILSHNMELCKDVLLGTSLTVEYVWSWKLTWHIDSMLIGICYRNKINYIYHLASTSYRVQEIRQSSTCKLQCPESWGCNFQFKVKSLRNSLGTRVKSSTDRLSTRNSSIQGTLRQITRNERVLLVRLSRMWLLALRGWVLLGDGSFKSSIPCLF